MTAQKGATPDHRNGWAGKSLAQIPSMLAAATLFALMVMTFCDVIMRSVFNAPIEAATELTRLAMAIIVFSSLPVVSWRGEHIAVDLFDGFFSKVLARIRDGLIDLVCGGALLWPAIRVWQLAMRTRESGDVTEYLNIPQYYIAVFVAISALLSAVILIMRAGFRFLAPHRLPAKGIDAKHFD